MSAARAIRSTPDRLSRRLFLGGAAALPVLATLPAYLARAAHRGADDGAGRVLVVVQLTGGNDGLNTVIPFQDDAYHRARPVLAVPAAQVIPLAGGAGLPPSLSALAPLWEQGRLAVVQGVGPPRPNRSHFRSMEIWHTAVVDDVAPTTGWLGRMAASVQGGLPLVRTGGNDLPLALAGAPSQAPAIVSLEAFDLHGAGSAPRHIQARLLEETCTGPEGRQGEAARVAREVAAAFAFARRLQALPSRPELDGSSHGQLGHALGLAAGLIGARLGTRVLYVTHEGYDTHARQGAQHARLLRELGGALAAFQEQLGRQGDDGRVATLVFSEFGRRIHENASGGTDHGAGNPVFVLGTPVRGGMLGRSPDLSGGETADVPVTTDFRRVYVSLLHWLRIPAGAAVPGRFEILPLFA